ncbi:MAG TPA: glutamine amidotransferase [Kofleriaceae bacterium]|nr:glutamine amidotransferase [Kofleriaceae bacterium]
MTIALLGWPLRIGLGVLAIVLAVLAGAFRRARPNASSILLVAAMGAAGLVAMEGLIAITVRLAAPHEAEFNEFRWVFLAPWRRTGLVLGLVAFVAIGVLAWRASKGAAPVRRGLLVAFRLGAAGLALTVFLEPAIELRQVAREPNRIAVLVDDSRSMSLREDPNGPTREQRVRMLLDRSKDALAAWREGHQIDFYTFSDTVAASSEPSVARTPATGPATNIRKALEYVRGRYDGRDLAGVVLISDGAATGGFDDATTGTDRDFLRSLETRVHTVWAARPGLRDVAIARVNADEFAFVRTVVKFEAVIRTTGFDARKITVTLSSDGQPLRQKEVELPAGDAEVTVAFEVTPPRVGRYVYEISTPVADGEAVATNNARSFVVRVGRDKIRVLQVAGQPSWDVRALRQMLETNPNVDLISFFILRTQDDISLVPQDEMSLIPFPTRELFEEQLPSFDLIVLQNFEYLPYGIGDYLENIRSYVEGGGGLVMLGGPMSFSSGGYDGTPVAAALPVELVSPDSSSLVDTQKFRPLLTEAGKSHPVTALRYAIADNLAAWAGLPELEGVNAIAGAKADATVLAVHPRLRTPDGKPMPVIAVGDYGQGRSMAVMTDTLWQWGFVAAARPGDDGRHYTKFWENAIRWLIQDPELQNLHVDSDSVEYAPGQPVHVAVRLLGRDYQPLAKGKVSLSVRRGANPDTAQEVGTAEVVTSDDGTGAHELSGLTPGVYRIAASSEVAGKKVTAQDIFLVRDASTELDRPAGDAKLLAAIADVTGGTDVGAVDVLPTGLELDPPRVVRVDRRADVELWSKPGLLVLALGLLGLEWLLRQRSGYL